MRWLKQQQQQLKSKETVLILNQILIIYPHSYFQQKIQISFLKTKRSRSENCVWKHTRTDWLSGLKLCKIAVNRNQLHTSSAKLITWSARKRWRPRKWRHTSSSAVTRSSEFISWRNDWTRYLLPSFLVASWFNCFLFSTKKLPQNGTWLWIASSNKIHAWQDILVALFSNGRPHDFGLLRSLKNKNRKTEVKTL